MSSQDSSSSNNNNASGLLNGLTTDQLKARYIGTGHADMSKHAFLVNQHRDTYASHVGHYDQLRYYAVARNESIGRLRLEFLEKMIQPISSSSPSSSSSAPSPPVPSTIPSPPSL